MSMLDWIGVVLLGGAGAVARFALDGALSGRLSGGFPYGTFVINLTGAFVLGLLNGLAVTSTVETLIGTATVGSYTTFSTWMLETHRLAEGAEFAPAALNIGASVFAGLAAVVLGRLVGAQL